MVTEETGDRQQDGAAGCWGKEYDELGGDLGASLGAGQHGDRRAAPRTALVLCHFHFWNKFSTKVDFDL